MAKALTNQTSSTVLSSEDSDLSGKVVRLSGDIEDLGIVKAYEKGVFISIVSLTGEEERQIRLVGRYKIVVLASNKNEYAELNARNAIVEEIVEEKSLSIPQAVPSPRIPTTATGFYIEPMFSTSVLGGQFDGNSYISDGEEIFLMPKFGTGSGVGVNVGGKWSGGSGGFYYFRASHPGTFLGANAPGSYSAIGLRLTRQFILNSRLQPYILMTFNLPRIVVPDGAATSNRTSDAIFTGLGLDFGVGLVFHVTPKVYIRAGAVYRGMMIGWVKGPMGETKEIGGTGWGVLDIWGSLINKIFIGGLSFSLATGFSF